MPTDDAADVADIAATWRTEVQRVLDELERDGLLSDARATESLVHARAPRYGQRRLKQALQARALPAELIDAALQRTRDTEDARARQVWRRRFGAPPADAREHARQMRFLLARGFDASVAQRVIRQAGSADDDEAPAD